MASWHDEPLEFLDDTEEARRARARIFDLVTAYRAGDTGYAELLSDELHALAGKPVDAQLQHAGDLIHAGTMILAGVLRILADELHEDTHTLMLRIERTIEQAARRAR
ncbi:MAG TPA: hypothetical protein VHC01_04875 [Gaiellaceae bacterium]|nr:hypothetical protein [Gaiellaceae bacterium]